MKEMTIIAGIDIGNGYTKGVAREAYESETTVIDILSGVAFSFDAHVVKPDTKELIAEHIHNIYNELDATFASPLISTTARRLFGERAIRSSNDIQEFGINSSISKADQDLSFILMFGCIAGKALQTYYAEHDELPVDTIPVKARVALSLPISEYKQHRKAYATKLKASKHMVHIHDFEQLVTVEIEFVSVQVMAEGASAQFAIVQKGEPLMNIMLADVRSRGVALEGVVANDVLEARNTIGIDIGEGTVNFPVFTDGRFNTDASATLRSGYGNILDRAIVSLEANYGLKFASRKDLTSFITGPVQPLKRKQHAAACAAIDTESESFVQNLVAKFQTVFAGVGTMTEVIYVYGGGATSLKEKLYPMLLSSIGSGVAEAPILYLSSTYSRFLNREGLHGMAESAFEKVVSTAE